MSLPALTASTTMRRCQWSGTAATIQSMFLSSSSLRYSRVAATQSGAGMLQFGRTAKILAPDWCTDHGLLSFGYRAECLRQRTIRGVRVDDAGGIRVSGERIDPPRFVRPAQGLEGQIRVGAVNIGTDLGAVVLDDAVGGVDAGLQRIPVDVHEAGCRTGLA